MKPQARNAFGTQPASGLRLDVREPLALPATLHVGAAKGRPVEVTDLTPRGCRVTAATDLREAAYISLMLAGATLISGRIAWNDGAAIGVDFCMPLLPKIVTRLTALGTVPAA